MTIPEGVIKLSIFEAFKEDHYSKWKLLVLGEAAGIYLCEMLEPLWNIFIDAFEMTKKHSVAGESMVITIAGDGGTLCSFRHVPDKVICYGIRNGRETVEAEILRKKKQQQDKAGLKAGQNIIVKHELFD